MSFFFIDKVQAGVFGLVCFLHRILTCTQCVDSAWEAQRMSRLFSLFGVGVGVNVAVGVTLGVVVGVAVAVPVAVAVAVAV